METITIKTQDEFDKLPDSFQEYTEINITGNLDRINRNIANAEISVYGSAVIQYVSDSAVINNVYDSAVINNVYDSAVIQYVSDSAVINNVYDSAVIKYVCGSAVIKYVFGSAVIEYVYDSAVIKYVYDSAVIKYVYDSAVIKYVCGSAVINNVYDSAVINNVYDSAVIKYVCGSAVIKYVCGSAVIQYVSDSAVINKVYDSAVINKVYDSAVIKYVCDSAVINNVYDSAVIKYVCGSAVINKADGQCVLIFEKIPKTKYGKYVTVIEKKYDLYDIDSLFNLYSDNPKKIILYKSVNPDTRCDFYTGKIKYEGVVECPDWDSDENIECGNGLHLSPLPQTALRYNQGLLLKCEVSRSDIAVYSRDISKVRCRKVKVLGECDIDGNLIEKGKSK